MFLVIKFNTCNAEAWCACEKFVLKFFSCLLVIFSLFGCSGALYSNDSTFLSPKNASGSLCIQQCMIDKQSCLKKSYCKNIAPVTDEVSLMVNDMTFSSITKGDPVVNNKCKSHHHCEVVYMSCFKACKGEILEHRNCVDNCEISE